MNTNQQQTNPTLDDTSSVLSAASFDFDSSKACEAARRTQLCFPVDESVVREELLDSILNQSIDGEPIRLAGIHRIGASSFGKALQRKADLAVGIGYIGANDTVESKCRYALAQLISDRESLSLSEALDEIAGSCKERQISVFQYIDELQAKNNSRTGENKKAVVYFDELTDSVVGDNWKLIEEIVRAANNYHNIRMVLQSHYVADKEAELAERLGAHRKEYLQPLSYQDTEKLVNYLLEPATIAITPAAIRALHQLTGGLVLEVALCCKYLMDEELVYELCEGELKSVYSASDIAHILDAEKVVRMTNRNKGPGSVFNERVRSYRVLLSKEQKELVRKIYSGKFSGQSDISQQEQDDLEILIGLGFIRQREGNFEYNGELLNVALRDELTVN